MYWNVITGGKKWQRKWLTLTWDVLKYTHKKMTTKWSRININMRCIEMEEPEIENSDNIGLTLTWDVLKFPIKFRMADDEGD